MSVNKLIADNSGAVELFMSDELSDITFIISERKIPAHKQILSMKSKVFKTMFTSKFKESQDSEIEIIETNYEAFKIMLRYIYTNRLVMDESYQLAIDVFKIGHRYQLQLLNNEIEVVLMNGINVQNYTVLHEFARIYELNRLKKRLQEFLEINFNLIINQNDGEVITMNNELNNDLLLKLKSLYLELQAKYKELTETDINIYSYGQIDYEYDSMVRRNRHLRLNRN